MSTAATRAPASRGWLARLLGRAARPALAPHLPIGELPLGSDALAPGEPALVLCRDAGSREAFVLTLLADALHERRVTWLCAADAVPCEPGAQIRAAASAGQLRCLSWTADAAAQLRRLGATHLLREMGASGLGPQDLFVLDLLDPWLLSTPDDCALEGALAEAGAALERWGRLHAGPVIALAPEHHRGQALLPLLARAKLTRLACFAADGARAQLQVLRWGTGARGAAAAATYELDAGSDGRWHCRTRSALDAQAAVAAPDEHIVHATRDAVADAPQLPPGWHSYATLESALAAAHEAVGATIVLGHPQPESIAALAAAVDALRREHPQLLKIVVRETGAALRRSGELALLRLGANAVLERELGFAHLQQRVESLHGVRYLRPRAGDAQAALRDLAPDPVQGYLAPRAFCRAVEHMIERTADAPLEHSLVQLPLLPHIAHLDALLACHPRRDGDVITADATGITLFLFGCADDDVMAALDGLFALPCSELATQVEIATEAAEQLRWLRRLDAAADVAAVDYATILHNIAPDKARQAVQATVLPMLGTQDPRCVQAHVLPLRIAAA